jgi:hypothetical protein
MPCVSLTQQDPLRRFDLKANLAIYTKCRRVLKYIGFLWNSGIPTIDIAFGNITTSAMHIEALAMVRAPRCAKEEERILVRPMGPKAGGLLSAGTPRPVAVLRVA